MNDVYNFPPLSLDPPVVLEPMNVFIVKKVPSTVIAESVVSDTARTTASLLIVSLIFLAHYFTFNGWTCLITEGAIVTCFAIVDGHFAE